jgi:hypothetical protein
MNSAKKKFKRYYIALWVLCKLSGNAEVWQDLSSYFFVSARWVPVPEVPGPGSEARPIRAT